MTDALPEPSRNGFVSQGIDLNYVEWGDPDALLIIMVMDRAIMLAAGTGQLRRSSPLAGASLRPISAATATAAGRPIAPTSHPIRWRIWLT